MVLVFLSARPYNHQKSHSLCFLMVVTKNYFDLPIFSKWVVLCCCKVARVSEQILALRNEVL